MILYVDNLIGSDSNNGSASFPLYSLDAAADMASTTEETEIIIIPNKNHYQISNTAILSKRIYMHSKNCFMIDVDINITYTITSFHRNQYLNFYFYKTSGNNISINTNNYLENRFENCRLIDRVPSGSVIWRNSPIYFKNCVIKGFTGTFSNYPTYSVNINSSECCENVAFIDCRNVSDISKSINLLFINSPCGKYPEPSQYIIDNTSQNEYLNVNGNVFGAFLHFKKCLLLQYGNYYSINEKFYHNGAFVPLTITNLLESIETDGFFDSDLTTIVNLNGDVFAPITKFSQFKLIYSEKPGITIRGIKKTNELVVASDDIDITLSSNIDEISITTTLDGGGDIKLAISIDKGNTWLTWNNINSSFEPLTVSISDKKDYAQFTEQEKVDWDNATNEIMNNGIDCNNFNGLNYNLLKNNTTNGKLEYIRFAYAIKRPFITDKASTSQLAWQFDANGFFREMTNEEKIIDVHNSSIKIKSSISTPIIKISVMV